MQNIYKTLEKNLICSPKTWLVTGVAGFIGSNILETLLKLNQKVVGLDNLSTGFEHNLREVELAVSTEQWANFNFIKGDVLDTNVCQNSMYFQKSTYGKEKVFKVDFVLHQAALGSVPRSIKDPLSTNAANITGFLNILTAARDANVSRFVFAASSSTYGDHLASPKVENIIGSPLSPYAVTKYVNELYANVYSSLYDIETIGLRYFNVFGKRQDADGAYAAVIPKWIAALMRNEPIYINGDGLTSRDFTYIKNVVEINLLAAATKNLNAANTVYNVAYGESTTLNDLYFSIQENFCSRFKLALNSKPVYREFREGDVRHSLADISKAKVKLGYQPKYSLRAGLEEAMEWYLANLSKN